MRVSATTRRHLIWFVVVLATTCVIVYSVILRFNAMPVDIKRRTAALLGPIGIAGAIFWIGVAFRAQRIDARARWRAILGPLGIVQLCGGLILLFWVLDLENLMAAMTIAAGASFLGSSAIPRRRRMRH